MQIFFGSVKKCSASNPPSLPTPDCLTPPKGVRKSLSNHVLTQTIPVSKLEAILWALFKLLVHNVAANPYLVLFA